MGARLAIGTLGATGFDYGFLSDTSSTLNTTGAIIAASGNNQYGFGAEYNGFFSVCNSISTGNLTGYTAAGLSGMDAGECYAGGNRDTGVNAQSGGYVECPDTLCEYNTTGFLANTGGQVIPWNNSSVAVANANSGDGFYATEDGRIYAPSRHATNNGGIGFHATGRSYLYTVGAICSGTATDHSPAQNTQANGYSVNDGGASLPVINPSIISANTTFYVDVAGSVEHNRQWHHRQGLGDRGQGLGLLEQLHDQIQLLHHPQRWRRHLYVRYYA